MVDTATIESLFKQEVRHVYTAHPGTGLPSERLPEVAFIGRSNVGKSSLINGLVSRKGLARTSNTPGATQSIFFYNLAKAFYLVDLPGYGFAKMSKTQSAGLGDYVSTYVGGRRALRLVCVLVDMRHGFKDSDIAMLDSLLAAGVPAQVVLTKADKLNPHAQKAVLTELTEQCALRLGLYGPPIATSSETRLGMETLRQVVYTAALAGSETNAN